MRILHLSDRHGRFPRLYGSYDVILDTGDIAPNFTYGADEPRQQMYWWEDRIDELKKWVQNHPYLFVLGNHDFLQGMEVEALLISNGINAKCLHDQIYTLSGVNFYGFPYVPPINGKYAFETDADEMAGHLEYMGDLLNKTYVDVIAAHCMPHGILDLDFCQNKRFGNSQMTNFLNYQLSKDMMPQLFCGGHIHSSNGLTMLNGVLYSNMATTQTILEL